MKFDGHTPVPWTFREVIVKHPCGPQKYMDVLGPEDELICSVEFIESENGTEEIPETLANGNLIAAAPDMLRVLVQMREAMTITWARFNVIDTASYSAAVKCLSAMKACDELLK